MLKGNELKKIVKDSGLSNAEIIEKSGVPERTLYNLYSRDIVEKHYVEKLKKALPELAKVASRPIDDGERKVPYYDIDATAGNVTIFAEDGPEYIKQYITVPAFNDCQMFIGVSGNSMYPKYCSGELVALKKIEDFEIVAFGEAYLVVTKEQRLLKYIRKGANKDHWLLVSENKEYEAFEVPKKKVLHLYIVKGKITKNII